MDYKDILQKASDISVEVAGKAYNLYNEGKKVVTEKARDIKEKAQDVSVEVEIKKDVVDEDVVKICRFAKEYVNSYNNFYPEERVNPVNIEGKVKTLVMDCKADNMPLDDYVRLYSRDSLITNLMNAYFQLQNKKGGKFTSYKSDLAASTQEKTFDNYKDFMKRVSVSSENRYLMLELVMEVVKYCFKHKSMASMADVINVLRGKNFKAEDGTKIDFSADLERCLANESVRNLLIAILRVEYKDTYIVNVKNF